MREKKLAIFIALCGWVVLIIFSLHEYAFHSFISLRQFFIPEEPIDIIFRIIILSAPIGSTITAYLINERGKLLDKTIEAEKQLKQAAHEWLATFDSMPYGIFITDNECNIIKVNKYISNFLGIPVNKLDPGTKCYTTVCKQTNLKNDCPLLSASNTNKPKSFNFYDHDHNNIYIESITPLTYKDAGMSSYIHVLVDITDIKEKEIKLIESKNAFFNMLKDIDSAHKELQGLYNDLVIAFANVIDAKSPWTKGHSERVTSYAVSIAEEMGVSKKDIEVLNTAGLLHDIGKIGTYDMILDKLEELTDEEFELVKKHPVKGAEILGPIKGMKNILPVIRAHHEKLDGTGYPDGLKGDEIPLTARILCVADSFDSMVSDRPYRPAPGKDYAVEELKRCSGTHFDPEVVEMFLKILKKKGLTTA